MIEAGPRQDIVSIVAARGGTAFACTSFVFAATTGGIAGGTSAAVTTDDVPGRSRARLERGPLPEPHNRLHRYPPLTGMTITTVPEPSRAALTLAGLGLAAWVARRQGTRART